MGHYASEVGFTPHEYTCDICGATYKILGLHNAKDCVKEVIKRIERLEKKLENTP